ncbi:MAG: hypothetical protein AB1730_20375, partial [Myxococcota bacterium]
MPSRTTWILAAAVAFALVACSGASPTPGPLGPETCDNGKDDNGDGKTDCLDPKCFSSPQCQVTVEDCTNGVDDNSDGFTDCADPYCAGMSCGTGCVCLNGMPNDGNGGGGGATGGGGGATGGGGGATGGGGGATGGGGGATGGGGGATGGGG